MTSRLNDLPTWLLSRAAARSHRILQGSLSARAATGYEYRILASVGDSGALTQADIGRFADLDRRDVSDGVTALEARGLVERRPHPTDGRRLSVTLTRAGELRLEALDAILGEVQDEVLAPLTTDQRQQLVHLLGLLG